MSKTDERALSFERAEGAANDDGPSLCSSCGTPIRHAYFQRDGAVFCAACRSRQLAERERGTPFGRFVRAALLGTGAAILGAGIWYGIGQLTGYEFGLIAIVIGLLVGGAVRVGSRRRGGWLYQVLAMLLTYTAIVSTYIPGIVEAAMEADTEESAMAVGGSESAAEPGDGTAAGDEPTNGPAVSAPAEADERAADEELVATAPTEAEVGFAGFGLGLAVLFLIAFAAPFLGGFENFMGWILIAIALYEAWKLNRREELVFEGPFRVAGARPEYTPETPPPPIEP